MRGFLYGQTEYNLLSNVNHMDDYIKLAKESGFDFLSITDKNLYGCYKFYTKCLENGIKPIIGLEYTYVNEDQSKSKLLLYAKNNDGYKELVKISTLVETKKIDTIEDIRAYTKNLYLIFVFNNSFIERLLYKRQSRILEEYLNLINTLDAYIGISYKNRLSSINLTKQIEEICLERKIKTIPIHQCKYLKNEDLIIYNALMQIGGGTDNISDSDDYSFDLSPTINSVVKDFVNSINYSLFKEKINLPKYPNTKGATSKDYLEALCFKGLERRNCYKKEYITRLEYELSVINKMGYDDYFLIVWDFVKYAKKNNILVGPGRGSAAGSLVAFALGITDIDPLKYDLLFERFLNPERVSMPDIDIDIPDIHRNDVIEYVKNLYGQNHVCSIIAYDTFQLRSSIQAISKIKGIAESRSQTIIEMILREGYDKLLEEYSDTDIYDVLYIAKGLVDLPRNTSTHAAGIILSSVDLFELIPLQNGLKDMYQSGYEAPDLEKIGLLKMDLLALRNLTIISDVMAKIPEFSFEDLRNIPLNDQKAYAMLKNADTLGIFQFEKEGMKRFVSRLAPTLIDDLTVALALYRPGPMDNIDEFIRRKNGGQFEYIHQDLKPILSSTYGIIVYQEQIMQIALKFAGYSLAEADILRRAISKKKADVLEAMASDFKTRCMNKGYSQDTAIQIYDLIYKFADYGFNKSHSVAYAVLAYQMLWFKANYFNLFMANIMNSVISNNKTLVSYIKYAKSYGLVTLKPHINYSSNVFICGKKGLYMPLNSIYSIGDSIAKQIVEERDKNGKYKSYNEFRQRCPFVNSAALEALVFAGAFDGTKKTKKSMMQKLSKEDDVFFKYVDNVVETEQEYEFAYLKNQELKYLGINLEYNVFFSIDINKYRYTPLSDVRFGVNHTVLVEFIDFKEITTKSNDKMLVGSVEDPAGTQIKIVMFPKSYATIKEPIAYNTCYMITGGLNKDKNDAISFSITSANQIK